MDRVTMDRVTIEVNDLFFDLTNNLDNCHELIRVLLQFKEECYCLNYRQELSEEINKYLKTYEELNPKENIEELFSQQLSDFVCDICCREFKDKYRLNRHKLIHSEKQFKCEFCDKKFTQNSALRGHQLRVHLIQLNVNFDENQDYCYEEPIDEDMDDILFNNKTYDCTLCDRQLSCESALRQHIFTHKKRFKCNYCDKRFAQKINARDHYMRVHNNETKTIARIETKTKVKIERNSLGLFECQWEGCGKEFRNNVSLRRHLTIHSGEKPFVCDNCGKSFRQKSNLKEHCLRVHSTEDFEKLFEKELIQTPTFQTQIKDFSHDGRQFVCNICTEKFNTFSLMKRHSFIHLKNKPFKCRKCLRSFSQKSNLKSHYLRIHTNSGISKRVIQRSNKPIHRLNNRNRQLVVKYYKKRTISCALCPQLFHTHKQLETHISSVHNEDNPLECPFEGCLHRFRENAHLEQHIKRHNKEFVCHFQDCDYRSHCNTNYQVHLSRHTGIELFKCDICGTSFDFMGKLLTHKQKIHLIEYPLVCEWPGCSNAYKSVAGLRKHSTLHTGEKKYLCTYCGMNFRFLSTLKIHLSQHTCDRPFKCELCLKPFAQREYLREHIKRVHQKKTKQ